MKRLLIIAAAVMALSLTAVAVGGAVSSAEGEDGPFEKFLAKVAAKLGVSEVELRTAIQEVERDAIDEAVAEGRITDERAASLKERVEQGAPLLPRRPHHPNPGPRLIVTSAAQVLGMEKADLIDQIKSGNSLAEVAEAQGMNLEDFTAALLTQNQTHLDDLVAEGKLTAEQGERIAQAIEENIDRIVNGHPEPGQRHCQPGPHRFRHHSGTEGSPMMQSETSITL